MTDSVPTNQQTPDSQLDEQLLKIQEELAQAHEREKRALADYQNLVRRNQDERSKVLKFANKDLIESLLRPLNHLTIAATELKDKGLDMVVQDFWKVLGEVGLEEINPEGEPFDVNTMEVVDKAGKGDIVQKVVRRGYKLNNEVIQHAQVVVG